MNVQDDLAIYMFGTIISVLLILSGYIKDTLGIFALFTLVSVLNYISKAIEPTVFTMFLSIIAVAMCMMIPIVLSFMLMFRSTKISEFLAAFEKIKVPTCVTIPFAVMVRFLPTVGEEWSGIRQAMAFRGIGLTTGKLVLHPIITAEHILVPLLSSCVSIMDELVAASLVRGLDSEKKRSCFVDIKMKFYDFIVLFICILFIVTMFCL